MRLNLQKALIALLLLPLFAGCANRSTESPAPQAQAETATPAQDQIKVIATFLPMYLFTKAVAGDAADVEILIQPGTEVHDYQSTPEDVRAIAQADVVVENGLGMETFLVSTIESAQNSDLKVIDASAGISSVGEISPVVYPTESEAEHDHGHDHAEEAEHNHAEGEAEQDHAEGEGGDFHTHAENPHVWLDPQLAIQQVENIRDGLAEADPANKTVYEANAAAYIQQLQELDRQFQQRLQPFSDRTFITFHDAFPYLANRYELKQAAIVAIPEDSLTPGDIQKTIETVKEYDVKALFGEPGVDNKLLQSLSQDLNLQLRTLDSLESGELDPQYYFTAMEANLQTLEAAFK